MQSLARRLKRWAGAFDFIVIDEAHHAAAGSWQKCCDAFPDAYRLGVTATPERLDGKALRPWFSELITGPGTWDLMQAGHLSQCKILCPPTGVDFKKLRVLGGDFRKDDAAQAMGRPTLMGDVVATTSNTSRLRQPSRSVSLLPTPRPWLPCSWRLACARPP